ncbi:TMV resistance protein N [Glycine max]|nr:TMV resistance protein N [Glycine max]
MEFASSSSPFSKSKTQWMYDVFINFRGEDIRKNFVSHLHSALLHAEVKTFLDDENLLKGMKSEELIRAIEGSQIAVVVFSKTYTESSLCLRELEKIIESHETRGQRVLPIFYEVDPSDVRQQKGDFGEALKAAAQKGFSGEHLESGLSRWSQAITKAANLPGWDESNHENDAELVEGIINFVLTKLDYGLSITKFPVGLESRVEKVIGFIENQSTKVCKVGIWGMGGLGKTTIAKGIYNRIHRSFIDKSFIEDVREVCETDGRGVTLLQEQLLSDVLKTKVEITSVGKGRTMIKGRLCGKRLLIVLDDVNKFGQLKDLCGNHEWFGQGSVLIITTRDLHLLDLLKVDYVYEIEEMDENESLQLFSWHAFGQPKPREDFNELARDVVAYCGGLPLALEVLGSHLISRTETEWESALSRLKMTPNDQIQQKLRISFDDLYDHMEKHIFLDICCFFIGKDKVYVTHILNGCGLHADIGLTVLIERSLVKVEKNNKLAMHNLLREMGREIIREGSRKKLGKRSRLWFDEDVVEILTEKTGTEAIEGLALKLHSNKRYCFKADAFAEMKRLRLLQLDNVELTGDYRYLSKQLRWISWKGFSLKYIPKSFYLEGAIAIDLKHSSLRLVWKEPQVLQWLKFLNLSHSKYLKETPDFSKLPNLEKLILTDCSSLLKIDTLDEDIMQMESLTTLIAENTAVKQVPFPIGLATCESSDVFLPGDYYPYWLAHTGEGQSVYFTVPEDCRIKGVTLCVVYLSTLENMATEVLIGVLMVNYTKCAIQFHKRETLFSFNDVDWQGIISFFGPGDKVEIFVIFGNGLAIKKTAVYLICDESIEMEMTKIEMDMEPSHLYCDDVIEKDTEPSNLYCDDVIEKDMEPSQKKGLKMENLSWGATMMC